MRTSEQVDKIIPALIAARASVKPAGKSAENKYDRYSYANEEDWHSAVMPPLLTNGLCITAGASEVIRFDPRETQKGGKEYIAQVKITLRLWHQSGQWIEVDAYGEGQDRSDKALYKAKTGAKKYGYALLFMLPTTDDPEKDDDEPPPQSRRANGVRPPRQEPPKDDDAAQEKKAADAKGFIDKEADLGKLKHWLNELPKRGFTPKFFGDVKQHLEQRILEIQVQDIGTIVDANALKSCRDRISKEPMPDNHRAQLLELLDHRIEQAGGTKNATGEYEWK